MRELALHITDLVENSIAAKSENIHIIVHEDLVRNRLVITVSDDGLGMSEDVVRMITDPFFTSRRTRKVGLGIPLLKSAAEACNGSLTIESTPGHGTQVSAQFQHDHIDRLPLGDLATTLQNLVICSPGVHFLFDYSVDDRLFNFDNEPILNELDGVPLSEPSIIAFLRSYISDGIASVQASNNYVIYGEKNG